MSIATATQFDGARRVRDWVQIIRQQFQETPHLCVTPEQASRLWGLEAAELDAVLSAFVDAHLLNRTRGGVYTLRLDPPSNVHGHLAVTAHTRGQGSSSGECYHSLSRSSPYWSVGNVVSRWNLRIRATVSPDGLNQAS